ncbi:hypothetical protein P153DRAFT_386365, partial [Dothidotthia symphoricarpi CBS 119687]
MYNPDDSTNMDWFGNSSPTTSPTAFYQPDKSSINDEIHAQESSAAGEAPTGEEVVHAADDSSSTADESAAPTIDEEWAYLTTLTIPDHTQTPIQDIPIINTFTTAYQNSYLNPTTPNTTRMIHANRLTFTLLNHYYPASQGYTIAKTTLGPIAHHGINFLLKSPEEPDSDPDTPPKAPQKKKKAAKPAAHYSFAADWHAIEPDDISALVVMQHGRPLTYLAIAIDDLATFHRWSRANVVHRADILTYALGVRAGVSEGYGILLFGPRVEVYDYTAADGERPMTPLRGGEWCVDLRE